MEFIVKESKKDKLVAELVGADTIVSNLIVDELWNDKDIVAAAFNIAHPLKSNPEFIIQTSGKSPKDALVDACKRVKKTHTAFVKTV